MIARDPDFFVIGLQKCGSYWATALLNSHPEINCFPSLPQHQSGVGEGFVFYLLKTIDEDGGKTFERSMPKKHKGFFSDLVSNYKNIPRQKLYDLFKVRYNKWCNKQRTKKMVGEKTVEYVFALDVINYCYPNIKKICILRDVKDRIVSFHFHQLRKGQKSEDKISNNFILDYCRRVKKEYKCLLKYSNGVFCFTYEDMSVNPKNTVNSMIKYLGASCDDNIVNQMIVRGSFKNLTSKNKKQNDVSRKRGQELKSSHFRKGVVGDWKNHISYEQVKIINAKIGHLQKEINKKYKLEM